MKELVEVSFVCLGNICRSHWPTVCSKTWSPARGWITKSLFPLLEPVVGIRGEDVVDRPPEVGTRQVCTTGTPDVPFYEASTIRTEAAGDPSEPLEIASPMRQGTSWAALELSR